MLKVVLEIFKGYTPVLLKGFPSIALVLSVLSLVIALTALSEAGSSDSTSPTTIQNDVLTLLKAEQVNALNRQLTTSQSDKLAELETIYTAMDQSLEQIVDDQKKLIQTQRDLSSEVIASKEALNLRLEGQLDLEKQLQSINNQISEHKASLEDSIKSIEQMESYLSDTSKTATNNAKDISILDKQISIHNDDLFSLKTDQQNMNAMLVTLQTDVSKLSSKIAEASVYAETVDAYFDWKAAKALSAGQPDSEEQTETALDKLSSAVSVSPNQKLMVAYNDWQNAIVYHLQEKKEAEFLTKLGNLLNAALAPE